jgi:predicted Zn-dependent peptidase
VVTTNSEAAENVKRTVLDNGITVTTESIAGVRSAAVGVWVAQGSAHESPHQMGISHLLEHFVFKGTVNRTAKDLALSIESLGGALDAYTSREHTSYQARVLDQHVPIALDVLSELVVRPLLDAEDLDLEREVVLEEIAQVMDTPDDLVFELHGEEFWHGHPYGYQILGTPDIVQELTAEELLHLHRTRYGGENLLVAAAGNVDHDEVVAEVVSRFADASTDVVRPGIPPVVMSRTGYQHVDRDTAQSQLVYSQETVPHGDPRRYAMALISQAFGGGMSSRLFQRVREEMGLAYSVFSFQSFYRVAGVAGVYVGTRPEWAERADEAIRDEYGRMAREALDEHELEQIKNQLKGQIMLSLESTGSRLYRLASFVLNNEPFLSLDESLARIEAVTVEDVRQVAAEFYDPEGLFLLKLGPEDAL